jgi:hypothetical protein
MIRTQVYLTEEQVKDIKLRSQREDRPEAEVIRDLVDKGLAVSTGQPTRKSTGETLLELVELGKRLNLRGPTDLSTNHDDYLYGDKE